MEQERRQRRGFGSFLPYILILAAIGAFIWMIVALTGSKTTRWDSNQRNLYSKITENHIQCVEVYNKETMYEVSGKGLDKENNAITFTFTCDAATFNTKVDFDGDAGTEETSIREELEHAVEKYQEDFPSEKAKSYFHDEYALEQTFLKVRTDSHYLTGRLHLCTELV